MVLVLRISDIKVVSVSRKKVVCYESVYIADPLTSPLHRHLVSVCDDLEDESKLKMPTFIKSIKAPFEALRDYEEDDAPNTVT